METGPVLVSAQAPTAFTAYLKGMETRDGFPNTRIPSCVHSLPKRNGNELELKVKHHINMVHSLPKRNGNNSIGMVQD